MSRRLALVLAAALTLGAGRPVTAPRPLGANHVVGDGHPASCTQAALAEALALGDSVTFNCGAAPTNILFNSSISITTTVSLDGGGLITLSGQNATPVFYIGAGQTLTLTRLTVSNGFAAGDGGAIYNDNGGALVIDDSTFRNNNTDPAHSGGAILNLGSLTISHSTFDHNGAGNGGAIFPRFAASSTTISNTLFLHNYTTNSTDGWGGAMLVWDGAAVTVQASQFISNTGRFGGALYIFAHSSLTLADSLALDNLAITTQFVNDAGYGGAIYNQANLVMQNTSLDGNIARLGNGYGGAIYNDTTGSLQMTGGELRGNAAFFGSAMASFGDASIITATLADNVADAAATIRFNASPLNSLTLRGTTVSGNSGHTAGIEAINSRLDIVNSTISGNNDSAALVKNHSVVTLTNATLAQNAGTGLASVTPGAGQIKLLNTLLAYNQSNCNAPNLVVVQHSLSSDTSCNLGGGQDSVDPLLSPLGYHLGPTLTHMLAASSLALDAAAGCPDTDQRGISRPQGPACDIGAVERRVNDAFFWLFLPLARR